MQRQLRVRSHGRNVNCSLWSMEYGVWSMEYGVETGVRYE